MGRQKKRKIDQISVTSSQAVGKDFDSKQVMSFPDHEKIPQAQPSPYPVLQQVLKMLGFNHKTTINVSNDVSVSFP